MLEGGGGLGDAAGGSGKSPNKPACSGESQKNKRAGLLQPACGVFNLDQASVFLGLEFEGFKPCRSMAVSELLQKRLFISGHK
jgi:hypothetical protein